MTTHPFGNMLADHEGRSATADALEYAAALLELRGRHRAAESVRNVTAFLDGYSMPEVVHAGLTALVMWARREASDPTLVRVGDRVKVTRDDEVVTGVWERDPATKRPYVQRDDTGEPRAVDVDRDAIEVLYFCGARDVRPALPTAVAVVRSAWLPPVYELDDGPVELTEKERAELDAYYQRRERERLCTCGKVAERRVVAWDVVESVEDSKVTDTLRWEHAAELGGETVCSTECALKWAHRFADEAVLRPEQVLRFRLDSFAYRAEFGELPPRLAQARAAATRAADVLDTACTHWIASKSVDLGESLRLTQSVQADAAQLLDLVFVLTDGRSTEPAA